mmetsp:Transcript_6642/g.14502  ORF Transcript_6642/g.14502 Transcript_6642/m.14502 type:complete len:111 (-) Transcript_6642:491-823(-)
MCQLPQPLRDHVVQAFAHVLPPVLSNTEKLKTLTFIVFGGHAPAVLVAVTNGSLVLKLRVDAIGPARVAKSLHGMRPESLCGLSALHAAVLVVDENFALCFDALNWSRRA